MTASPGRPAARGVALGWALAAAALLFLRSPAHLLDAQLWAEDGWNWYPDAYRSGLASLATSHTGYLQTLPRLMACAALLVPIELAPTVMAALAFMVQLAPPVFLLSPRLHEAWPDRRARGLLALACLCLPNAREVYVNATNAQWHLALLALLVVFAAPPRRPAAWAFDASTLLLCGLSGPFCILLAPLAAYRAVRARGPASMFRAGCLVLTALVQLAVLSTHRGERSMGPLGASFGLFCEIVAQQVLAAPVVGEAGMPWLRGLVAWRDHLLAPGIVAGGLLLCGVALRRGPPLACGLLLFGAALLGASLVSPQASESLEQWTLLALPGVGQRYHVLPMIAWIAALLALAFHTRWPLRLAGIAILAGVLHGAAVDYLGPDRPRTGFAEAARTFESAAPGVSVSFPILPPGVTMVLVKRGPQ